MPQDLITTTKALNTLVEQLRKGPFLAVDTEFHREKTYFPELCLIQVATPDVAAAVDPLAEGLDLASLLDLLNDKSMPKVFHAGRQDLEIFWHLTGKVIAPIFDTQIAAMALGYGDQISYINLIERVLSKRLSKAQQLTNWKRRPLTDKQINYALDDVIYLRAAYPKMKDQLKAKGRLDWLQEEETRLTALSNFESDPKALLKNLRLKDRSPQAYTALNHLVLWRDNIARTENKPRHHILKNDALLVLAQQRPQTPEDAKHMRMIHGEFIRKYGADVFAISTKINQADPSTLQTPPKRQTQKNNTDTLATKLANLLIAYKANHEGITPRLIASSADVENFVNNRPSSLDSGWRYTLVGQDIKQLMEGKISLAVRQGQLICHKV